MFHHTLNWLFSFLSAVHKAVHKLALFMKLLLGTANYGVFKRQTVGQKSFFAVENKKNEVIQKNFFWMVFCREMSKEYDDEINFFVPLMKTTKS